MNKTVQDLKREIEVIKKTQTEAILEMETVRKKKESALILQPLLNTLSKLCFLSTPTAIPNSSGLCLLLQSGQKVHSIFMFLKPIFWEIGVLTGNKEMLKPISK